VSAGEQPADRLAALLDELEAARLRLEAASDDPDAALAVLEEVNRLAREAAEEVERVRRAVRDARDDERDG
jgi:hypothetical protein